MDQVLEHRNEVAPTLKIEDLRVLEIHDLGHVNELIEKYVNMHVPRESSEGFAIALTQRRDAWFIEAGEFGLIYLTELRPYIDARLNWVFWDERLSRDRLFAIQNVLHQAFEKFALPRVSAYSVVGAIPVKRFLMEVGFTYEGTRRRGWVDELGVGYRDLILYGMLREEQCDGPRKQRR